MKYELVESKLNDVFKFLIITLVRGISTNYYFFKEVVLN